MSAKEPLFTFFGTPRFAVVVLDALEERGLLPALVVTAPDKQKGRGLKLSASPVKEWALERGIDVLEPNDLKDEQFIAELKNTEWDVFIVAAYNKILPKNIFDIPNHGTLNVHPSLLPKFRGPSPALSAILSDERATGVTIMQIAEKMDAGPIVAQAKVELEESAWPPKGSLFEDLLAKEGGTLLAEILPDWIAGKIDAEEQNESLATYTRKFKDEDARINIEGDPHEQLRKIRAFDKNPRAYFLKGIKRVIITEAQIENDALVIKRVIPEGKKEMSFADFLKNY
ncbi:MAG TPA: methionyl-tRNA formyltransferase [Candidatus Paceibacterota bacterium]|nr:methionyl-tRNA formyltransferase [Candidatus Paceibacterota bacterium]